MPIDATSPPGAQFILQEAEAQVSGLARSASDILGLFSPSSGIANGISNALHLPDPLKQIVKLGAGVLTGDVAGAFSAIFGLVSDVAGQAAQTTYHVPRGSPCAPRGYAASPPPSGQPARHELHRQRQALEAISRNFEALDNAAGVWFPDGRFGGLDLNAVMSGPYPQELKDAVRYLRSHPDKYMGLDAKDGLDGFVSRQALDEMLEGVNRQIAHQPAPACVPAPSYGGPGFGPWAPPPPGSSSEPGAAPATPLEASQRAVNVLEQRLAADPDNKQLQLDLQKAQNNLEALFTLLSNLSRSNHEMAMTAIRNLSR